MTRLADSVAVDFTAEGVPRSLGWRGELYLVSDTPTRLASSRAVHELITHPLGQPGWRFQAGSATGDTRVFDIARDRDDRWILLDVYQ